MNKAVVIALMSVTALSGCQTVKRGSSEVVKIFATPSNAKITTSLGHTCKSPCEVKVKRRKKFTVTATHPGYVPQTVAVGLKLDKKSAAKTAGSFIIPGGTALVATDVITKANYDHDPNPVRIKLKRAAGS